MEELIKRYFEALKAGDAGVLHEVFSDDAVCIDSTGEEHRGLASIKRWFDKLVSNSEINECVLTEFNDVGGTGIANLRLDYIISNGKSGSVNGEVVIQVEDGKIIRWRDFFSNDDEVLRFGFTYEMRQARDIIKEGGNLIVREYNELDINDLVEIWNEVVKEGVAFPQEDYLDSESGAEFFSSQSYAGVAIVDGKILGLYILHPNNIGRCGHICNASYAVSSKARGLHIGEKLVKDSIKKGKELGFGILQFNAVVESNVHARHLYERLGFVQLGTIPKGFRMKDGQYENICPYYIEL